MSPNYLLGLDVGSSSSKCVIIDETGRIIAQASERYSTFYPCKNWAEQNPEDWYGAACTTIRRCLALSEVEPARIAGIAIAGPAHNVALMDEAGEVIHPTIHWSDLRSAAQSERLESTYGDLIFERSYCRVNPAWTLPQLLWLKENSPSIFSRLRRILVTKDYVRFRLTGQYLTDTYDAIGTQLFDLRTGAWSPELLELIGYRRDWLPEVHSATELGGTLTELAARDTGLGAGTPVAIGSGDSVVEAAGIGAIAPGHCVIKLGTAANVNLVMQNAQPAAGAITYRHVVDDLWFSITATNAGASTLTWFAETFCQASFANGECDGASAESSVEALAAASSPGAHGLLFHPYLQGERSPYWDPHLRGNFVGISRRHGLPDFARAVMEGVAFSLRDCFELVSSFGESISNLYLIGGGAKSGLWSQIVCDVLGRTLSKPAAQSAAFGSALLAGIAIGLFADWRHALASCAPSAEDLRPDPILHELYSKYFSAYREITRDMSKHDKRLNQISELPRK